MRLQKLTLENFQGIKNLVLDFPGGCSASIYGDNGTGKTTVYNALTWLLFDKASTGAKNFTPKTRDTNGEIHGLTNSVAGEFILDSGEVITLQKAIEENWKKKRGALKKEFSGNVTNYSINGVPVKQKDYEKAVLSYCGGDSEKIKILTMPDYFAEVMKWEDRRAYLLDMCGNVSDEDVMDSDPELPELKEFLKRSDDAFYSVDEYQKMALNTKKQLNKQLDEIPPRIDELTRTMPDTSTFIPDTLKTEIQSTQTEVERLTEEKAKSSVSDKEVEKQKRISTLEAELEKKRADYYKLTGEKSKAVHDEVASLSTELADLIKDKAFKKAEYAKLKNRLTDLNVHRDRLLKEWNETSEKMWNRDDEICPTCGRPLDSDKVQELISQFNFRKSQKLSQITAEGQRECSKDAIAKAESDITVFEKEIDAYNDKQTELEKQISELNAQTSPAFEVTPEYKQLNDTITALRNDSIPQSADDEALTAQICDAKAHLKALMEQQATIEAAKRQNARIEELQAMQKDIVKKYERNEKALRLIELFTVRKVSLLTSKINERFKSVSFQLFASQINGGLKETCEVLIPCNGRMIPYSFANNAARINAGLEIIDTFSHAWKITMPLIVDNAESVTKLNSIGSQVIRLVVSEKDKTLRLVTEQED